MNWLAHVLLSPADDVEFRLGNLLADLVKGRDRHGMSAAFLRGARCHQAIDAFTDYHPVTHRSRGRLDAEYGRFAGILVDVFYDHFLARDWARYCPVPLAEFTARFYADVRGWAEAALPAGEARESLERMAEQDTLGSYLHPEGIALALRRVSCRLAERVGVDFALERAVSELAAHEAGLAADFAEFFPLLRAHAEAWVAEHPGP